MNRLSILIYHRVLPRRDPMLPGVPDQRQFARHMAVLRRLFRVLPLSHAVRLLQNDALPARAACITFDDGYADNVEVALPVLRSLGLNACFFIASGYLDGGCMWNDEVIEGVRVASLPSGTERAATAEALLARLKYMPFAERQALARAFAPPRQPALMMSSAQLRQLHGSGMEIGAHTVSHPILRTQDDQTALADIVNGKSALESIIGAPVTMFAYPNGKPGVDFDQRHTDMVKACGFVAAVTTAAGAASASTDLYQLPRFTPWEADRPRFLLRLLENRYRPRA
jgi:peptidoglycan/xylan/chitin deacetylase (PgdA/CDA1 family)